MSSIFDAPVDRRGTLSEKWDNRYPGWEDALPMWVADMDFKAPEEVTEAITARAAHGVYGYTLVPDSSYEAAIRWRLRRHADGIRREWITFSPGVVCSMKAAVDVFTVPGDGIAVQTPVYAPFLDIAVMDGRRLLNNPLRQDGRGRWEMDLDGLEACFRQGARLLLLCNTHNPVGRVWTKEELGEVAGLCIRYGVTAISDEIHCDIRRPGFTHTPIASLPGMRERSVTLFSATKTFNLAGLQTSVAVTADPEMKKKLEGALFRYGHGAPNLFGLLAQEAAWTHGGAWLDELNAYIAGNVDMALGMLAGQDAIRPTRPEGTYLLWLDCRGVGASEEEIRRFFAECGVWPTLGRSFGGEGFVRLNLATQRARAEEGVGRILAGLKRLRRR